jgi:hypothetical protein
MHEDNSSDDDDVFRGIPASPFDDDAWRNVAVDFLDPLVDKIVEWCGREPGRDAGTSEIVHWLGDFTLIVHAIVEGIGPEDSAERWQRAAAELAIEVSPEFRSDFEARVRDMSDRAETTTDGISAASADRSSSRADCLCFLVEVENFCFYLHNCSLILKRRLAHRGTTNSTDHNGSTSTSDASEPYLGLCVDETKRKVTRDGVCVRFGKKDVTWELFIALYKAGETGRSREELYQDVYGEEVRTENALDQQKKALGELFEPLRVEVATNNRGIWKLAIISPPQ